MSMKFIITQDNDTANILINFGFKMLSKKSGTYFFANNNNIKMNFDAIDKSKIHFTNMLYI